MLGTILPYVPLARRQYPRRKMMKTTPRPLNVCLAFSAVCASSILHAGIMAPAGSGRASFSPAVVQNWTSSISGLFDSRTPDLMALNPLLISLKGADLNDQKIRTALAPIYSAVQSQVLTLQANAAAAQAAPPNPALQQKYIALDILSDFQRPETRSPMAEFSRAYYDTLPIAEKEKIRSKLVMLKMESIAQALERTGIVTASVGNTGPFDRASSQPRVGLDAIAVGAPSDSSNKMPDAWKLRPASRRYRRLSGTSMAGPREADRHSDLLKRAAAPEASISPPPGIQQDLKTAAARGVPAREPDNINAKSHTIDETVKPTSQSDERPIPGEALGLVSALLAAWFLIPLSSLQELIYSAPLVSIPIIAFGGVALSYPWARLAAIVVRGSAGYENILGGFAMGILSLTGLTALPLLSALKLILIGTVLSGLLVKALNALAASPNNSIAGLWGIGFLSGIAAVLIQIIVNMS